MSIDFKTVVPAAQAGDRAARESLMGEFWVWSVAEAYKMHDDVDDARDAALAFWERTVLSEEPTILQYSPTKGAFFTWLSSTLRNFLIDRAREQSPDVAYVGESGFLLDSPDETANPEQELEAVQFINRVSARFTMRELEIVELLAVGSSQEEIAHHLNVEPKTAREYISRLRNKIAKFA